MKIAVFSDIHGNYQALKAILKKIGNNYDEIVFLGDIIDLGPDSYECVKLLKESKARIVLGNHDLYYTRGPQIDSDLKGQELKHHMWTKEKLRGIHLKDRKNDRDLRLDIKVNGFTLTFIHFFLNHETYPFEHLDIFNDDRYKEVFAKETADYVFYGHNHEKDYRKLNGKHFYGIGSSGCTKNYKTYFYSITVDKEVKVKKINLTYDRKTFENRMNNVKFPDQKAIKSIFFGLEN